MIFKLIFVCSGNAIRSPYAASVMNKLLKEAELTGIEVSSLGTIDWGQNPRDPIMVDLADKMGYTLSGTTSVMNRDLLMAADSIIVFEQQHRDQITRVLDYDHWDRIHLFNRIAFDEGGNVQDPHYQSLAVYQEVANHIEAGCKRLVEKWQHKQSLMIK